MCVQVCVCLCISPVCTYLCVLTAHACVIFRALCCVCCVCTYPHCVWVCVCIAECVAACVRQPLTVCVLGCNQQHSQWSAVLSDWGFGEEEEGGGGAGSPLPPPPPPPPAPGSRRGEQGELGLWFGAASGPCTLGVPTSAFSWRLHHRPPQPCLTVCLPVCPSVPAVNLPDRKSVV